ncbi:MAG: zinc permease [Actinobacteria bacterium]|nr:zinc permease [Actinomycetota bacterium]
MSTQITFANTVLLGFIAGATISLGLLLGRMKAPAPRFRALLNAIAIGILIFLFVDVLHGAVEPLEAAIDTHNHGLALLRTVLLIGGLAVGILGLVGYDSWSKRRRAKLTEVSEETDWTPAARMSLLLAVGIGLHNFGEGLAIGSSAHSGAVSLTTVLVVGFALHNATEGFGIIAPLSGASERASWKFLGLMAIISGGPTTLGTIVGWSWTSDTLSVAFYALAAGSIIYVVAQLFTVAQRQKAGNLLFYGIIIGISTGLLTELIVELANA